MVAIFQETRSFLLFLLSPGAFKNWRRNFASIIALSRFSASPGSRSNKSSMLIFSNKFFIGLRNKKSCLAKKFIHPISGTDLCLFPI